MQYVTDNGWSYVVNDDGERELMANFVAEIVEERRIKDGLSTQTFVKIAGRQPGEGDSLIEFPIIEMEAAAFSSMNWVLGQWGTRAIVRPGGSIKDHLRTMIQSNSKPKVTTVYRHLGWAEDESGKPMFLHAKGAIRIDGNDPSVQVMVTPELSKYDLSQAPKPKEAVVAMLELVKLAPAEIMWPLLAATLTPIFGPVDFAIHVSGRTGTFKSELMSLCQSFYGPKMDARNLPGSWSSTPNALEAQAFYAANSAFVLDDFVPAGTSYQQKTYQAAADKIIRAQGNQAGRARLTDTSNLQQTMYPRGIILSTGEDVPEGHSVRARMLILELTPGDIAPATLTKVQALRPKFCGVVAGLAQMMMNEPGRIEAFREGVETLRSKFLKIGHSRTPGTLARLVTTVEWVCWWMKDNKWITEQTEKKIFTEARDAIVRAGEKQQQYLEDADPADQFKASIRHAIATGVGHIRSMSGGTPAKAEQLGWIVEHGSGEMPAYRSRGTCIGWVQWRENELYINIDVLYPMLKKISGNEMTLSKQTLLKRLADAGILTRRDSARQRNTIRVTADGSTRIVLALAAAQTIETELPQ